VLVVDDGSSDATATRAREAGRAVASLPFNQGLGAALQTGYLYALREGYDFCAHLDADGQHPPAEVARLLEEVRADRADLVIGSRYRERRGAGRGATTTSRRSRGGSAQRLPLLPHPGDAAALHRHDQRHAGGEPRGDGAVQRALLARLRRDRVAAAGGAAGLRVEEVPVRMLERAGGSLVPDAAALGLLHLQGMIVLLVGQFRPRRRRRAMRRPGAGRAGRPQVHLTSQTRIIAAVLAVAFMAADPRA
jgi:hypothetical protein